MTPLADNRRSMSRTARLALLAVLALAVAGCGGDDPDPRSDKSAKGVRATAVAYVEALGEKRYDDACALLTASARRQLTNPRAPAPCDTTLQRSLSGVGPAQLKRVKDAAATVEVVVKGATARSAPISGATRRGGRYRYLRGLWYIADAQGR